MKLIRNMLVLLKECIFHPFSTSVIDLNSGKVIKRFIVIVGLMLVCGCTSPHVHTRLKALEEKTQTEVINPLEAKVERLTNDCLFWEKNVEEITENSDGWEKMYRERAAIVETLRDEARELRNTISKLKDDVKEIEKRRKEPLSFAPMPKDKMNDYKITLPENLYATEVQHLKVGESGRYYRTCIKTDKLNRAWLSMDGHQWEFGPVIVERKIDGYHVTIIKTWDGKWPEFDKSTLWNRNEVLPIISVTYKG